MLIFKIFELVALKHMHLKIFILTQKKCDVPSRNFIPDEPAGFVQKTVQLSLAYNAFVELRRKADSIQLFYKVLLRQNEVIAEYI